MEYVFRGQGQLALLFGGMPDQVSSRERLRIPGRRFLPQQVVHKEVFEFALSVRSSRSVMAARNIEQVEGLIRLLKAIDNLEG